MRFRVRGFSAEAWMTIALIRPEAFSRIGQFLDRPCGAGHLSGIPSIDCALRAIKTTGCRVASLAPNMMQGFRNVRMIACQTRLGTIRTADGAMVHSLIPRIMRSLPASSARSPYDRRAKPPRSRSNHRHRCGRPRPDSRSRLLRTDADCLRCRAC